VHLKILTYNIHKCIGGLDRRHDPLRITTVISRYNPDVVLLQEIVQSTGRSITNKQVEFLGNVLGFRHRVFFPNVMVRKGGAYGNAILSHFPATDTSNIDVTLPPKKTRRVLHARYRIRVNQASETQTRTLHIYNLHLGLSGIERKIQLRKFLASQPFVGLHQRTPIIIGGDFNDVWGTLGKKLLVPAGFTGWSRQVKTFPAWGPIRPLDAIYSRGDIRLQHVYRARTRLATRASDHLPLIAEFQIG